MKILYGASLLPYNTFGVEAVADCIVRYSSVDDLAEASSMLSAGKLPEPFLFVGQGSNILFCRDFHGTVLHSEIDTLETVSGDQEDTVLVRAGSGRIWDDFVAFCVANGWYGAENLSAIPGQVGAAAVQNIGAYGSEAGDIIYQVETFDMNSGQTGRLSSAQCRYSYRDSVFKHQGHRSEAVTHVTFRLSVSKVLNISYRALAEALSGRDTGSLDAADIRKAVISIRSSKLPDPSVTGSAGSFFMNPVVSRDKLDGLKARYPEIPYYPASCGELYKLSAGWLIDKAGWKGRSLGRAGVYEKQALVLVNLGGATGEDIYSLSQAVSSDVAGKFGIELRPEVRIIR